MHFYQFNIGDYHANTGHLDPLEDIAYRRMLDWVYLHESPLPMNVKQIARFIRMTGEEDRIESVLADFFEVTEYGYAHKRAAAEIDKFRDKSEKAKAAIAKRWAAKPVKPHTDVLQTYYERNTNQEPITNNQEPIQKDNSDELSKKSRKRSGTLARPVTVSDQVWADFLELRKVKRAPVTQTALKRIESEAQKAGLNLEQALETMIARGWAGFSASWLTERSQTTTSTKQPVRSFTEMITGWIEESDQDDRSDEKVINQYDGKGHEEISSPRLNLIVSNGMRAAGNE